MSDSSMDWERIVRENANAMLRLAIRIVGCSADAEELVQEAFLKAYQYQQRENVKNWGGLLHRFVVNAAGCASDKVSALIGDSSFRIKPRLGEYILLHKDQVCRATPPPESP